MSAVSNGYLFGYFCETGGGVSGHSAPPAGIREKKGKKISFTRQLN